MKLSHEEVNYEHPAKNMNTRCENCLHYQAGYPPGLYPHCEIVKDPIRPEDWCKKYAR